jgi:DNA integrity scanning protein DisA with diadenylate cyclase activity
MPKYSMTETLMRHRKKGRLKKPRVEVSVYVKDRDDIVGVPYDENKYLKKDLVREVERVAKYEKVLKHWVPEDIAAKAKEEVEKKLAESKIQVRELKARIKVRS